MIMNKNADDFFYESKIRHFAHCVLDRLCYSGAAASNMCDKQSIDRYFFKVFDTDTE